MKRIDILGSVGGAWRFLAEHPAAFLRICGVWFVILLLASIAQGVIGGWLVEVATLLLQMWASLNIIVSWHRAILIEPAAARLAFTRKEFRILVYSLFFAMPFVVVIGLLLLMPGPEMLVITAIASLGLLLVLPRFALVFPAVAVGDEATTLEVSGAVMRGNVLRLAAAALLAGLPCMVVVAVVQWLAPGNTGAALLIEATNLVGEVVGIGVLCAAYRLLIQAPPVVARA